MTPTPQERSLIEENIPSQQLDGNRVVISGMSGLYPRSHNVKDLSDILYNKVNPVTPDDLRFKYRHPEVMQYAGTVPDLEWFDAQFFKVHYRLAFSMDPMAKKVLEQSYQAIYDAGINPEELSGKKVGVYIGSCFSETEKACFYEAASRSGFGIAGCSKTMFANRISYWLNAKGPSMSIDEACCSSTAALEQAYLAMTRGECEAAIVGGSYLCLHPQSSAHYSRIIRLCSDGKTKSFDENANGCARSEAINILFLQKAKDALRIYAEVLNVKTEYSCMLREETGPKYGFYRDLRSTTNFIKKFYEDTNVSPQAIEYVEAFGSALPEADEIELKAIEEIYCKNRDDPLFIGSVMSNIGYGEAASGISAITKVLLGYHTGKLAANMHCDQPRKDIEAFQDGRMRLLTEHQSFQRSYVAVNGMSVTGVNSHVLLHGHYKPKDLNRYKSNIPYLVAISGRHEEAVKYVLELLKTSPIDPEQLTLLHNVHRTDVSGHLGRGFTIIHTDEENKTVCLSEKAEYFDDARRPLWFVYSGMGSQWTAMGTQLMRIPIFAAAIERCRKALEPKGIDIVAIITSPEEKFSNILHSFVGIAAIQIGLTDILRELGLKPDGIIGHSVGELGCSYADGCLTAEEMILAAYYRGLVSLETEFIHGSMAAVGLGYEQIRDLCPPEIQVACHNGPESSTISGPSDAMRKFVAELTEKGIFAKEVPCSNIAYHSRYIANAGPGLLKYLNEVITSPKARSERWISSSVPKDRWDEPIAKFCSPEYLTNNLLNPVLFEETSRLIPNNAVLVEIAPHGLLQAILKRSMPSTCINIPLTRRGHADNTFFLLEAIGKLYMQGYNSDLRVLYPKVELPVSTGTPFLSNFVKWAHGEKWPMAIYNSATRIAAANCNFVIALHDKENTYMSGHSIRGYTLYPFAASLSLVWDTLTMIRGLSRKELSVEFNDVQIHAQPILHNQRQLKLNVAIHRGTGRFEVLDGVSKVTTGFIQPLDINDNLKGVKYEKDEEMYFTAEDVYQLLQDREYSYRGEFQSIKGVNESLSDAKLSWQNNWVTFIDGMIQLNVLNQAHNAASLPTRIRRIRIDVEQHEQSIQKSITSDNEVLLPAEASKELDNTRSGGVLIEGIQFKNLPPIIEDELALKSLTFVSNEGSTLDIAESFEVYCQVVAENVNKDAINIVGIKSRNKEGSVFDEINNLANNIFGIKVNYQQITRDRALKDYNFKNVDLLIAQDLSMDTDLLQKLQQVLQGDQFVAIEEDLVQTNRIRPSSLYRVVFVSQITQDGKDTQSELRLVRWGSKVVSGSTTTISVRNESDLKFLYSVRANLTTNQRLLIVAPYPTPSGLKDLVKYWRGEATRNNINLVTVNNDNVDSLEENLSKIELAFNVVDEGAWGGEFYLPLKENATVSKKITLQSAQIDNYDSLNWVDAPELTGPGVTVTVHYAGINNNDINRSNGSSYSKQNIDNSYGSDFSGFTPSGKRVMGMVKSGAASSQVRVQPEFLWPVPEHWSLEDAATVPLAYAQAFYCLVIKLKLYHGMAVLVHGGAGALGQALISIALAHDCVVFTTVSDIRKKRFLMKLFPQLKAENIGNSRDHTFGDMVKSSTGNKGCDIVISSCDKSNLKDLSIRCTAHMGSCLDVSQLQNQDNYTFGMYNLFVLKNYATIDFSSLFSPENANEVKVIHDMISDGIVKGYVRPLPRLTYAPQEVSKAFRLLATNQHRGRVLLRIKDNILQTQHRINCNADSSHLLFSDEDNFGLQLADRLVTRGAKKLYIHVPKQSAYLQHKIRSWQKIGVNVIVLSGELDEHNISTILSTGSHAVEGVYVTVASDKDSKAKEAFVEHLDLVLRKLDVQLKYFAVLNIGDYYIGKNVCLDRLSDKLPATLLTIPELNNVSYTSSAVKSAIDAAEEAIQSCDGILLAHKELKPRTTLLQKLTKLAEINIPENTDKNVTLHELGVQYHKLQLIRNTLQLQYQLALEDEQVSSLTINTILELERAVTELPLEDGRGLQTFFNFVDSDELLATTDMMFLPTLTDSATMRDDEFDMDQQKLYLIPGIEGHHERFRVLCERIKTPALVLQSGLDHPNETLKETAERIAKILLTKTGLKDTFYLLGYESGVLVALEIAAILEKQGLTGTVFCLGCTPEELKKEYEYHLAEFETEDQLQDGVLRHMYTLMAGNDTSTLEQVLQNINTWSEKLATCVRILLGQVPHSAQYARTLIECALGRIQQARSSTIEIPQLRSKLVLLRAVHDPPEYEAFQQYSSQPIVVHQLNTKLAHVTKDLNCATIINEHFDSAIQEAFAAKNICDTYLLNGNSFMAMDSKVTQK